MRLPSSAARNHRGHCKLIVRVLDRNDGLAIQGPVMRPGATVEEAELRRHLAPGARLLVVEFLPPDRPAGGWRRHDVPDAWILWAWDEAETAWVLACRVDAVGSEWVMAMRPVIAGYLGSPAPRDALEARRRVEEMIERELAVLTRAQQTEMLAVLADQIAMRVGGWVTSSTDLPTYRYSSLLSGNNDAAAEHHQSTGAHTHSPLVVMPGGRGSDTTSPLVASAYPPKKSEKTLANQVSIGTRSDAVQERTSDERLELFRAIGRTGGLKSAQRLSLERRIERARNAALARHAKKRAIDLRLAETAEAR